MQHFGSRGSQKISLEQSLGDHPINCAIIAAGSQYAFTV